MRRTDIYLLLFLFTMSATGKNRIYDPQVKSLQAVVNQNWLSPLTIMRLNSHDCLNIGFDELSHDYHRYIYHIERCEADWSKTEDVFESEWLEGFNDNVIDDYEHSINTTVAYTHYQFTIPNDRCRLTMSGNYKLRIADEDSGEEILIVEFMVTEQSANLSMEVTTNTDIDTNISHQQVSLALNYGSLTVTHPDEQLQTIILQNGREDNCRRNVKPNYVSNNGLEWRHNKALIFDGGNEYRKYEILDTSHPTMGIDYINWDGENFQVFPFISEPRLNYLYDEDANGAFYIRNSDNIENDTSSDYVWVNYRLISPPVKNGKVIIDGQWTTEESEDYQMNYDASSHQYNGQILQKQGYYSYQYLWEQDNGQRVPLLSEGNFYQTENSYQALVYFKGSGDRSWRLVSYGHININ